LKSHRPWNK
jgi:hypothetical protein